MSPTVSVSSSTAISSKMNSTNGGSNPSEQVVSVDLVSKSHYHNEGKHWESHTPNQPFIWGEVLTHNLTMFRYRHAL